MDTEFTFNSPGHVAHVNALVEWSKDDIFRYGGRRGDSQALFTSGECAAYFNSSAGYAGIKRTAEFDFGIGMLPYWPEVSDQPQNSIIGGATLWVLQGHDSGDYEGVAKFFSYLSSAEVQADWHQFTGYLPITMDAYELTKEQGFYDANPGTETAILQMTLNDPTANSKGLRLRQLRADPRYHQRGAGSHLGRRQDGRGRAEHRGGAGQLPAAPVRGRQLLTRKVSRPEAASVASGPHAAHGKARHLQ